MNKEEQSPNILYDMPKRIPKEGTFELTLRCNLHCKMCMFRHADCENPELMKKELTAQQWIDMAKQAADAGTMSLLITGGEPMLRPDFCEIWEGIYKQGFLMQLYTNATLVTPQIMETLKKYPPHKIGVTLYGASPKTYKKVCGSEEAFQKMIDGVCQLQTLPSVIEFRTTLIQDNFSDAKAIDEFAQKNFNVKYGVKQASPINKAVRGACTNVEACRISPELDVEMKACRMEDVFRQIIGSEFDPKYLVKKEKEDETQKDKPAKFGVSLFGCQAGMSQYTITYDGKLLACQMIGSFYTDAFSDGLKEAWDEFPYKVKIARTNTKCESCEFIDSCQSCYGSRYAETGDYNGCSDYIYRMAKARKQYKIFSGGNENEECQL